MEPGGRGEQGSRELARAGQRILAQARGGSAQAQERLVRLFTPAVAAYVRRRTGARLARFVSEEDLVQEVLVRAIRALEHLREGADLGDFRRLLFLHARWVLQRRGREAGDFAGETLHGRAPLVDGPLEGAVREPESTGPVTRLDRARWLHTLVRRLDPLYADALRPYLEGASFAEIAARLGIEEEAARKRVVRGTVMLGTLVRRSREGS